MFTFVECLADCTTALYTCAGAAINSAPEQRRATSPVLTTPGLADHVEDFRPRGVLVAHFAEHLAAVSCVAVSRPKSAWLATASNDGTVKVWGAARDGVHLDKVCLGAGWLSIQSCVTQLACLTNPRCARLGVHVPFQCPTYAGWLT